MDWWTEMGFEGQRWTIAVIIALFYFIGGLIIRPFSEDQREGERFFTWLWCPMWIVVGAAIIVFFYTLFLLSGGPIVALCKTRSPKKLPLDTP